MNLFNINPRSAWVWVLNHTIGLVFPIYFTASNEPETLWDWFALIVWILMLSLILMILFNKLIEVFHG